MIGAKPEGADPGHAHSAWTKRIRIFVVLYVLAIHILVVGIVSDPSIISRAQKFIWKTPVVQPEYQGMVSAQAVASRSLTDGSVVVLGDSRMRDLDCAAIVEGPVYNFSIGGDTTRGLQSRIRHYDNLNKCRFVVIGVGVNDLSHFDDNTSLRYYEGVISILREKGALRLIVCSILPVDESVYRQANAAWFRGYRVTNARIRSYNIKLRALCEQFGSIRFVDVTGMLADEAGNLKAGCSSDGLHLTDLGNRTWAAALKSAISSHSKW